MVASEQRKTHSTSGGAQRVDEARVTNVAATDRSDMSSLLESYRRELYLHCYRLLGSLHDAEDVVQETMLRAWRHFDTFQGRGSLRSWLYSIATNACLDVLKQRPPRTLPQASYPATDPHSPIAKAPAEILWLEPFPDTWLAEAAENPEARYTRHESISLAFLTALHLLPPRQRAILLLSDVLDWRANEIARLLELSVPAVTSALHRARVTLTKSYRTDERERAQVSLVDARTSTLLSRYVQAWETDDVAGLVALLKEEATLSMPPFSAWYRGREAIRSILTHLFTSRAGGSGARKQWHLSPTSANAQPAFVLYRADASSSSYQAFGLQVVTLDGSTSTRHIAEVTIFNIPSLVISFGFPLQWPE